MHCAQFVYRELFEDLQKDDSTTVETKLVTWLSTNPEEVAWIREMGKRSQNNIP